MANEAQVLITQTGGLGHIVLSTKAVTPRGQVVEEFNSIGNPVASDPGAAMEEMKLAMQIAVRDFNINLIRVMLPPTAVTTHEEVIQNCFLASQCIGTLLFDLDDELQDIPVVFPTSRMPERTIRELIAQVAQGGG